MDASPQLRCYMSWMALASMEHVEQRFEQLPAAGFTGVQFELPAEPQLLARCRVSKLGIAGGARVNAPAQAESVAEQAAGEGYECVTLHVGWGLEDNREAHALIDAILTASERWKIPLYPETHRATIFQDMWRTVGFARKFPSLRFNGDFSHWYAGQEMVYGGFDEKLAFIQPILERVRFLHGRIANPGCIQVAIEQNANPQPTYLDHFRRLWIASFRGFLREARPGDFICFTPELLAPNIYYARTYQGVEESGRWEQSLILKEMAEDCFACAQSSY